MKYSIRTQCSGLLLIVSLIATPVLAENVIQTDSGIKVQELVEEKPQVETMEDVPGVQPAFYEEEGYVPIDKEDKAKALGLTIADELFIQSINLNKMGKSEESIELLFNVISVEPSHHRARLILARQLVTNEQYVQVENVLLPLLHKSNTDWRPWFFVGTAQLMSGELDLAAYSLDKALNEAGRYQAAVWVQRAIVEQQRDNPENALQLLRVAAELAPDDPQVYINMAYAYEASGADENAIAYYQRFVEAPLGTVANSALRRKVVEHLSMKGLQESTAIEQ